MKVNRRGKRALKNACAFQENAAEFHRWALEHRAAKQYALWWYYSRMARRCYASAREIMGIEE